MAITSLNNLVNKASTAASIQRLWGYDQINNTAYRWTSMWNALGFPGNPTGAPTNQAPTNSTQGAIPFTNAAGGNALYLAGASVITNDSGSIILYDRLSHMSGLDGTLNTAQTVNTTALTRSTDGVGVHIALEVYTATGASAANVTASYTNQAGTSGHTTTSVAYPTSALAGTILRLPLQAGDTGVKSVETLTLSATTGTAGNFGVTLYKPILSVILPTVNMSTDMDYLETGLRLIPASACLSIMEITRSTSTPQKLWYNFNLIEA